MANAEVVIRLSQEEYERLLLLMGFGVGAAFNQGDTVLAYRFLDVVNAVNKFNPQFIPYRIPEGLRDTPALIDKRGFKA